MDSTVLGFILQVTYAVGAFTLGHFWNKSHELSARQLAMEKGTRALLKTELCRIHRESTTRGGLPYDEESLAEELYSAYHALGGNGQGTTMINDIREMMKGNNHG